MSNDWQNNQSDFGQPAYGQADYGQPAYGQPGFEQPRRGWFGRNWWWFIPLIILLPIIACGGCCVGFLGIGFSMLKSSEPYQMALAMVQRNPEVQQALGTPINDVTWFPMGEFNVQNDRGTADLIFQVEGPKGRAKVSFSARKVAGQWALNDLVVTVKETGERIAIDTTGPPGEREDPAEDDPGEAPPWDGG